MKENFQKTMKSHPLKDQTSGLRQQERLASASDPPLA